MRFEVIADGKILGWTRFEGADPPMGAVFGKLHMIPPEREVDWSRAALEVRAEDGHFLRPHDAGKIMIEDHRESLSDTDAIEVTIVDLPDRDYASYFRHHLSNYDGGAASSEIGATHADTASGPCQGNTEKLQDILVAAKPTPRRSP